MPNMLEIQVTQKHTLFDLLSLEKRNARAGIEVLGLEQLILKAKAGMTKEEIAYVKELVDAGKE